MSASEKKRVVILGATGSVGVNTLKVIERFPDRFELLALTAHRNVDRLAEQVRRFTPRIAAVGEAGDAVRLERELGASCPEIVQGVEGLIRAATLPDADVVVSAIVGAAGLVPTVAALREGKTVALANKETLVMAGRLVMEEAASRGARILPVDSEHSAIHQCLAGQDRSAVRRLILTASGGPFLDRTRQALDGVLPEDALRHPRWDMGRKITIDSATLMNKGLEVIEAHWLFDLPLERIHVLVHPQSIVHSMVEFVDGSVLAQMGVPDMRGPISYALGYPERLETGLAALDLVEQGPLTFLPPDEERFPCLSLAREAMKRGGVLPAVMNAANEVAVRAFLDEEIGFTDLAEVIRRTMADFPVRDYATVEEVLRADREARRKAREVIHAFR